MSIFKTVNLVPWLLINVYITAHNCLIQLSKIRIPSLGVDIGHINLSCFNDLDEDLRMVKYIYKRVHHVYGDGGFY